MELQVGMHVRDNDPRSTHRGLYQVREIDTSYRKGMKVAVLYTLGNNPLRTVVAVKNIHMDGKPRRTGWSITHD